MVILLIFSISLDFKVYILSHINITTPGLGFFFLLLVLTYYTLPRNKTEEFFPKICSLCLCPSQPPPFTYLLVPKSRSSREFSSLLVPHPIHEQVLPALPPKYIPGPVPSHRPHLCSPLDHCCSLRARLSE